MKVLRGCLVLAVMLVVTVFNGCLGVDEPMEGAIGQEDGVQFVWSPPEGTHEFAIAVNVTAGPGTRCETIREMKGVGGSPSGIDYFGMIITENLTITGVGRVGGVHTTAHLGSVNTGQVTHNHPMNSSWYTEGRLAVENGTFVEFIAVGHIESDWHPRPDINPWIEVICDSDQASIRYWEADDYQLIHGPYAEGGVGVSWSGLPSVIPAFDVNNGDSFRIATESNKSLIRFFSHPYDALPGAKSFQEGRIAINTPEGQEILELGGLEHLSMFQWHKSKGEYELYVERIAYDYWPLSGLLAGFVLQEEVGGFDYSNAHK